MILLTLAGCLTLDPLFFSGTSTDAYALEPDLVPWDAIEYTTFRTEDDLELWGAWAHQPDPDADVLVYFHGKSGDIDLHWKHRVEPLWALGFEVFVFDYRGYGRSEGNQDGLGILTLDGVAAIDEVVRATGKPPEDLYWYGLSLGGAVATHTSAQRPARAITIESTFASAEQMLDSAVQLDLPAVWFVETAADNVAAVRNVTAPLYIIHGLADDFVDPNSGVLLFEAAPQPKSLWQPEGVDHGNLAEVMPQAFADNLTAFYGAW